MEAQNPEVYPNPFLNSFTIRGAEMGAIAFLYTADGRLISKTKVTGHEVMITELQEFAAGIYILRISGKSSISNVKITKNWDWNIDSIWFASLNLWSFWKIDFVLLTSCNPWIIKLFWMVQGFSFRILGVMVIFNWKNRN